MRQPFDKEKAYSWATSRCSRAECCKADIRQKLIEKGLSRAEAQEVLDRLEDERFIDDSRFAEAFVHDKTLYDRWGRIKTTQALRMKGISDDDIRHALQRIDEADYAETLLQLLEAKRRQISDTDELLVRNKLIRYAAGRGFEPDLIFSTLDRLR